MPNKSKKRVIRAAPPSTAAPPASPRKPKREVIEIHTTTERTRNASGGAFAGNAGSTIVPVLGGIAGGTAAVIASQRFNGHSGLVAAGTAAAGLAAMSLGKQQWLRQAGAGAVVGAAVVGAVPLVVGALSKSAPRSVAQAPAKSNPPKRSADGERDADPVGDGYVTRHELNDALGKLADSHKETSKQQTCDLMTALRDEIRKVVAEGPNGPGTAQLSDSGATKSPGSLSPPYTSPFPPSRIDRARMADGSDDYTRNAYGDDIRDAEADEYTRNAYGDDIRDAEGDDYARNAYGDDLRDADGFERDADGFERDADGWERDADAYDERNAEVEVFTH